MNPRRGFSLIEVAIALAIAASVMVWTYSMISQALLYQRKSISLTNAVFLAKIKMAQVDALPKLETSSSKGDIPGYVGFRYELEIKEEEMDLLKMAEGGGDKKKPEDLLGKDNNSQFSDLLKKRGQSQTSKTGGLINVFRITLKIIYPSGNEDEEYSVETFKARNY